MPVARPPTEGRFGGRGERGLPARLGGVPAPLGGSLLGIYGPRRRPSLREIDCADVRVGRPSRIVRAADSGNQGCQVLALC
jgi:hypothetical protein